MRTKNVIGQKIVAVKQSRVRTAGGVTVTVDRIILENGLSLIPTAYECENDGPVGDVLLSKCKQPNRQAERPGHMNATISTETRWTGSLQRFVGHPSKYQALPKAKNKCKKRSFSVDTLTISGYGVGVMSEAQ